MTAAGRGGERWEGPDGGGTASHESVATGHRSGAVPALLVTHGAVALALKAAAESISGAAPDLECFSNEHLRPEDLADKLAARLDALGAPILVLVDLAGGSTLAAAQRACRGRESVYLVAGVNLPLVLDYLQKRGELPAAELVAHIVDRGRQGIRAVTAPGASGAGAPPAGD